MAVFSPHSVIQYVPLAGSEREPVPGARRAGPADPNEVISVTLHVRSRASQEDLDAAFAGLARQPTEQRSYLSRAELDERFGGLSEDMDAVEEFAHHFHLYVLERDPNKQTVILGGRVSDFSNAFKVALNEYHHPIRNYRGRTGPVYIPQQLNGIVTGVFGLDDRPKRRARYHSRPFMSDAEHSPNATTGVPNGLFTGRELAQRYQFPKQGQTGAPLDGTGQTVAIIELGGGYLNSDLTAYFQGLGLPVRNVVAVSVDHGQNHPTPGVNSPDGEVMLDIEVLGAVVPSARQIVYFAPNQGNGFFDAIAAAVMDNQRNPSVISISWGGPEDGETDQTLTAMSNLFKKAALLGVTICVASGDHGSIDIDPENPFFAQNNGHLHVDAPACLAGSLACGGTSITASGEQVWNDGDGWSSGGGVSVRVPRPSYQTGTTVKVPASPETGFAGRGVPDVSGSATHYFVRVRGHNSVSGGTSAVAPLWAGLIARLNQAKGHPVGFVNPILYAHPEAFNDVGKGNNDITSHVPPHYPAAKGWDPATGLGVPIGTTVLKIM